MRRLALRSNRPVSDLTFELVTQTCCCNWKAYKSIKNWSARFFFTKKKAEQAYVLWESELLPYIPFGAPVVLEKVGGYLLP